ncbi:MAG: DNA polymerase III subunit delta' [Gemmataceae bacterium]|nr:DNA polymerase III subunit delta' [Gemmataceae bacterium]
MGWEAVQGHDALKEGFRRVVERGRLAHAYLFAGPEGVGKKLFATELARALLCDEPPATLRACGECPSCAQIGAGTHPDFTVAGKPEDAHEFPIEAMREVCSFFSLRSARGKGRIVVIDDADDLNEESANCFLKTLEEPPPRSMLVLVGSGPERQLPTINSRCQVVRFAPMPDGFVRTVLDQAGIDDPAMQARLVRLAGGSPGRALALADPALWEFRSAFLAGLLKKPIDTPALSAAWMAFVEASGKESALQRAAAGRAVGLLLDVLSDALAVAGGSAARRTGPEDAPAVRRLAERFAPETLIALLERCMDAEDHIGRRVQLVLALEALLDALAQKLA